MREQISFESKEKEPKHNIVIVDFLRHGTTEYQENFATHEEKAAMNGNYPRDLTPKGEQEVRATVEKIVKTINPETDIVALWSSPAWRAQGSEEILIELLEEHKIPVHKDSSISSMRNFAQHDKEFMNELWTKLAPTGKSAELMYARDPEFQEKNDKFESQPEVKRRAERVFHYIQSLAEKADLQGKRLRIIGVSHFEFLNPMIEEIFGAKVEKGEGVVKGEEMSVTFDFDPQSKAMKISADFRGEHKDKITFDKNERHFEVSAN
ncbi:MAG: phosphoglycerate mutase family protein [bacterium]